ncbi:hypothetical protein BKA67DRAFT_536451 [Truncatella angustata]|uniref:Uncharacterized protein n=1 Tax=Truncatella angustata TaxID=152316 RepID=A0A9P8ZX78_9PEZI|nr:uncharacterized protein BKA67DRAFT_536451 [Truncatella angustata]KAH6652729.1 hypothetical protein BKA67DRAFT_536451 [Truncatella angustata]
MRPWDVHVSPKADRTCFFIVMRQGHCIRHEPCLSWFLVYQGCDRTTSTDPRHAQVRLIQKYFTHGSRYTWMKNLGSGANGLAMKVEKDPLTGNKLRDVDQEMSSAMMKLPAFWQEGLGEITQVTGRRSSLVVPGGREHIIQCFCVLDTRTLDPGTAKDPVLIMEFVPHGDLGQAIERMARRQLYGSARPGRHPDRALWRMFRCHEQARPDIRPGLGPDDTTDLESTIDPENTSPNKFKLVHLEIKPYDSKLYDMAENLCRLTNKVFVGDLNPSQPEDKQHKYQLIPVLKVMFNLLTRNTFSNGVEDVPVAGEIIDCGAGRRYMSDGFAIHRPQGRGAREAQANKFNVNWPGVGPVLRSLVADCLAKESADRPMLEDLKPDSRRGPAGYSIMGVTRGYSRAPADGVILMCYPKDSFLALRESVPWVVRMPSRNEREDLSCTTYNKLSLGYSAD